MSVTLPLDQVSITLSFVLKLTGSPVLTQLRTGPKNTSSQYPSLGLPPSNGKMVVHTVVGRFSKATHFIPLPKLPSVRETATIVLDHIFRIHGLPVDVVSDRGPQFVSKFWTEFCGQLGATARLSSGYHPCFQEKTRLLLSPPAPDICPSAS